MNPSDRSDCRREPLAVEALVSEDQRRLSVALGSVPALPASLGEECANDLRKISRFDEIDQALADPIHDHRPQSAPGHKVTHNTPPKPCGRPWGS